MNRTVEFLDNLPLTRDPVTYETILDHDHGFYSILQPIHKTPDYSAYERPDYSREAVTFFVEAVEKIDADLQQRAGKGDPLVRQLYSEDEAQKVQNRVNQEVMRSLRENPRQITIGSFYGVKSPFERVRIELRETDPDAASRLSGAIVSSTTFKKREPPVILTPLDPRWGDATYSADIWEDLADSAATATAIAAARIKNMLSDTFTQTYPDLPTQMQRALDNDFRHYTDLYRTVVSLMEAANIAIVLPVSKNEPFMEVLREHVHDRAGTPWAERQSRYLDTGILVVGQRQWLMGANQFDSGLVGQEILDNIPSTIRKNPIAAEILKFLPQSRVRIGSTTRSIIELMGTGVDLNAHVGKELGEQLKQRSL